MLLGIKWNGVSGNKSYKIHQLKLFIFSIPYLINEIITIGFRIKKIKTMINNEFYANTFGVMTFGCCLAAFSPTVVNLSQKCLLNPKMILKMAHIALLLSIFCGLVHGLIMTQKVAINFYDMKTYWVYGAGLFTLNLLIFCAFSFRELTRDSKKLNYFTYAGLVLILCHFVI